MQEAVLDKDLIEVLPNPVLLRPLGIPMVQSPLGPEASSVIGLADEEWADSRFLDARVCPDSLHGLGTLQELLSQFLPGEAHSLGCQQGIAP